MNPRLGACFVVACAAIAFFVAGCNQNPSTTPVATPTPVTTGPDTLFVQDGGSKTVRVYTHASNLNGLVYPSLLYPTSDPSNPDIVYYEPYNILYFPSAYPFQTYTGVQSTPIRVWTAATAQNGANPNVLAPFADGSGAVAYDSNHDLLYVGNVTNSSIAVYKNAHLMNNLSAPAATVTLKISDPQIIGPRPQDMLYDATHDRLFVSDQGTVVASFDKFGATALSGGPPGGAPSRQIIGLDSPDGLAYSPVNDVLYIGEISARQIDVIHNASTFSGPSGHSQVINGFISGPNGMAYDALHDLLFVFDPSVIWVIPGPAVASGNVNSIVNRRQFFDGTTNLVGFGVSVDPLH